MIDTENKIREIVLKEDIKLRQKVIEDLIKTWDKEGIEGDFPQFIIDNFAIYWIKKVRLN